MSKLSDADWMAYVESFDFVTLTETFIDENFDLSHVFTDYFKFVSPAIKLSHQGRTIGWNSSHGAQQYVKFCSRNWCTVP